MAQEKGQVLIEKNKNGSGKVDVRNMQAKPINQGRGPTTGNAGSADKRAKFVKEKASSGNEKSAIANMITDALSNRGAGMKPHINPAVEGLHADTGPKRNPTAGGTHYTVTKKKK
jgi:hypothetical protein